MQIKLAKKNGTFEPPVKQSKGHVQKKTDVTVSDFMDEYVEVYGLKKWGNSYYSACVGLINNYIKPYVGERYVRSITTRDIDAYYTMLLDKPAVVVSGHMDTGAKISAHTVSRIHKVLKSAAHGFDADRKLIAQEMDSGFFAKVGEQSKAPNADHDTMDMLRAFIKQHPELVSELLKETDRDGLTGVENT